MGGFISNGLPKASPMAQPTNVAILFIPLSIINLEEMEGFEPSGPFSPAV